MFSRCVKVESMVTDLPHHEKRTGKDLLLQSLCNVQMPALFGAVCDSSDSKKEVSGMNGDILAKEVNKFFVFVFSIYKII